MEEARARGLKITADQYPYQYAGKGPDRDLIPEKVWLGEKPETVGKADLVGLYGHLRDHELIALYEKATPFPPLSERHKEFLAGLSRERLVSLVTQTMAFPDYLRMGVVDPFDFQPVDVSNTRQRMDFLKRLNDPEEAKKIREMMNKEIERAGAENIIVEISNERELEGKSLAAIAREKGKSVEATAIELGLMGTQIVPLMMAEDDIEHFMKKDYVATGSDGDAPFYGTNGPFGSVHLRSYTTFLHKIEKYALERKAISVEHAIRSQTSLPAEIMGFSDRGWIREGYKADINVIDLKNLKIRATVANPSRYCEGVRYLIINGRLVIDAGKFNGTLAGEILKPGL
jgi:N-acyl-D-aspartate/D-glutamate deacylase